MTVESWSTIRVRVGARFLAPHFDGEWPTPDQVTFWNMVDPEDTRLLIFDQLSKLADVDKDVAVIMAACYSTFAGTTAASVEEAIEAALLAKDKWTQDMVNPLLMSSHLLIKMGVDVGEGERVTAGFLENSPDLKDRIGKLSGEMQTLAWYSLWLHFMEQIDPDGFESVDEGFETAEAIVDFLTYKLEIVPPREVI